MDDLNLTAEQAQAFAERQLGRPLSQTQAQTFLESVRVSNRAAERQARRCVRVPPVQITMRVDDHMTDALSFSVAGLAAQLDRLTPAQRAAMRRPKRRRWDEERVTRVLSWAAMIAAYVLAAGFILALVAQWWGAQ